MNTDYLINALVADTRRPAMQFAYVWAGAVVLAIAVAVIVFFATLGLRPDFAAAVQTPRFLFKFVVTISLAVGAFVPARALSRPDGQWRKAIPFLAVAPTLLAIAVVVELFLLPSGLWTARTIGKNSMVCLTYIPLIGIGPLAIFLAVLRYEAPVRRTLAGAVCGIFAGAIAATLYAAQCTDDSPLFVATWYSIAIAGLAVIGAVSANALARW
ncbi:MAG: hypothetical protein BGO93_09950 [Mesorhizobium sp. 65-26]|uniref:NrsF family protein n=1 Tax=Mesorhizobium sp. 65-26 TaxID=1895781 RepID=UPI00096604DD|nr:NrsF family protein [Mesorhizobium sp. 65-26]MBN9275897.1 DUF1109 family protein [Mesorhizobium sp.]OJX76839.1 MAG: hypothetical protein BGO93_09950 [Mesorhizobium sp. 65-26]